MKHLRLRWIVWASAAALVLGCGALLWRNGYVHYVLALSGDPVRQYEYGRWLYQHKAEQEAIMWISMAADNYEPRAMGLIGALYAKGEHFTAPVAKEAFWYVNQAAHRNQPMAMMLLATMYEGSEYVHEQVGVEKAQASALVWYLRAANGGVGPAIDRIVKIYENGELGMGKDLRRADMWRKRDRKPDEYWQHYND